MAAALALTTTVGGACVSSSVSEPVVEESTGELGQGVFRWDCVDDSDGTCGTGVFPSAVAVGSRFGLEFFPDEDLPSEIVSFSIDSVSPRLIDTDGGDFVARDRGTVSLLATGDGYGVDFVVIQALPIDRIELTRASYDRDSSGPTGPVAQVGRVIRAEAALFGGHERLAGALDYEWDNLTPDMVELYDAADNEVTLFGVREGVARIAVRAGEYSEIIELTVEEAPPEPEPEPTTGEEDSEGGDTGGSDTGGSDSDGSGSGGETEGDTDMGTSSGGETEGGSTTGGGR